MLRHNSLPPSPFRSRRTAASEHAPRGGTAQEMSPAPVPEVEDIVPLLKFLLAQGLASPVRQRSTTRRRTN